MLDKAMHMDSGTLDTKSRELASHPTDTDMDIDLAKAPNCLGP